MTNDLNIVSDCKQIPVDLLKVDYGVLIIKGSIQQFVRKNDCSHTIDLINKYINRV